MYSGRKVLENRTIADEERINQLEEQLKESTFMAEDADRKYDEVKCDSRSALCLRMQRFCSLCVYAYSDRSSDPLSTIVHEESDLMVHDIFVPMCMHVFSTKSSYMSH